MSTEMSLNSIKERLDQIVLEELDWAGGIPTGSLSNELDSVQRLSLIVAIEDTFKICFDPEDEETIDTIEDLCLCIKRLKESQQ
jgi:acyl carrier protein